MIEDKKQSIERALVGIDTRSFESVQDLVGAYPEFWGQQSRIGGKVIEEKFDASITGIYIFYNYHGRRFRILEFPGVIRIDDIVPPDEVLGCTNPESFNYNSLATMDDGSCVAVVLGCTDPEATNYDPDANTDDASCTYDPCAYFTFTYVSDGDANGVFYYYGTDFGAASWINPITLGALFGNASSFLINSNPVIPASGGIYVTTNRAGTGEDTYTFNNLGDWIGYDLGDLRGIKVSAYSMQSRQLDSSFMMRNWKLQGSNVISDPSDALTWSSATWVDLDVQTNNTTLVHGGAGSQWLTISGITPSADYYRFIRIVGTGYNSGGSGTGYQYIMMISEFELYGELQICPP